MPLLAPVTMATGAESCSMLLMLVVDVAASDTRCAAQASSARRMGAILRVVLSKLQCLHGSANGTSSATCLCWIAGTRRQSLLHATQLESH